MLQLPQITLVALTNKDFEGHRRAVAKSCESIRWGGVKIIWDETIQNIDDWNKKVVYDLWKYVDTDFCMLIHADGYVTNPEKWDPKWLNYDYIGAPWPLPNDDYSYRTETGELVRVGNSVSLRSRKLLKSPSKYGFDWRPYYGNTNEDGFFCVHHRTELIDRGMVFAPLDVAVHFSREHEIPENKGLTTFAFHTVDI